MKILLTLLLLCSVSFAADKPNFIVVYVDDLGWTDTSLEMIKGNKDSKSDFYQTPHLERLAKEGMVFSRGYAPAPVCTPSRNSMMHGISPAKIGNSVLYAEEYKKAYKSMMSIPQALKKADSNYRAAHFGKWHIIGVTPKKAGFDVTCGPTGNGEGDYMDGMKTFLPEDDPKRMIELTDKTIKFMEDQVKDDKPFFVQLSHYAVHIWHDSLKSTRDKYRKLPRGKKCIDRDYVADSEVTESEFKHNWIINYAAMIDDMDVQFGRLLDRVESLGIKENTYVIFTSDNGGGLRGNDPLVGAKGDLTEGGIRVPYVISGPKVLKNSYNKHTIVGWDLLPTVYDLAGGKEPLPANIEGGSWRSLLEKGNEGSIKRKEEGLVFHFPWYNGEPESCIMVGNMKLLKNLDTKEAKLYNVEEDLSESKDLSHKHPELAKALETKLTDYLNEVKAEDVISLRKGFLERLHQWIPQQSKQLAKFELEAKAGDKKAAKEVERIKGYIKWMKGEVQFTIDRAQMHGADLKEKSIN